MWLQKNRFKGEFAQKLHLKLNHFSDLLFFVSNKYADFRLLLCNVFVLDWLNTVIQSNNRV